MARFSVPLGGRVRKSRAVEDHSAPIPEEITIEPGRILQKTGGGQRTLPEKRGPTEILLGRKAGTDRGTATLVAAEGIPEGFHPGKSGRVA